MIRLFRKVIPSIDNIIARIHEIDSMPHADIYSRWEADKQILELTRKLKEMGQC